MNPRDAFCSTASGLPPYVVVNQEISVKHDDIECPYCEHKHADLAHLSTHGVVGITRGGFPLIYRCACGFESERDRMEHHWMDGGRKHAALCAIGDIGDATPIPGLTFSALCAIGDISGTTPVPLWRPPSMDAIKAAAPMPPASAMRTRCTP